jgi:hypothetical protein
MERDAGVAVGIPLDEEFEFDDDGPGEIKTPSQEMNEDEKQKMHDNNANIFGGDGDGELDWFTGDDQPVEVESNPQPQQAKAKQAAQNPQPERALQQAPPSQPMNQNLQPEPTRAAYLTPSRGHPNEKILQSPQNQPFEDTYSNIVRLSNPQTYGYQQPSPQAQVAQPQRQEVDTREMHRSTFTEKQSVGYPSRPVENRPVPTTGQNPFDRKIAESVVTSGQGGRPVLKSGVSAGSDALDGMNSLKQKWVAQKRALDGLDQSIEVGPTAEGQGAILENPKQAQRVSQAEVQHRPVIQAKSLDTGLLAQFLGTDPEFYQDAAEIRRKTEKELSMNQKIEAEFSTIVPRPSTPTPEPQNPKTEPLQETLESKIHSIQRSEPPKDSIHSMNARNLSLSKTNEFLHKEN